jgi:hypothetical protein
MRHRGILEQEVLSWNCFRAEKENRQITTGKRFVFRDLKGTGISRQQHASGCSTSKRYEAVIKKLDFGCERSDDKTSAEKLMQSVRP